MLNTADTALLLVDVQGKLAHAMHDRETLFDRLQRLLRGIRVLGLPVVWAEQNPDGLGPTIPQVADLLRDLRPIPKMSFSCCAEERIMRALQATGCRSVLIAGIEAHICVYQTAVELANLQFHAEVVADACSSRTAADKHIGLQKCRDSGVAVTSVETLLFELAGNAHGARFKQLLEIVK
jgi:nicotinamidase-related amidase